MENLINTDIGLISKDNANWLFTNKILSRTGGILDTKVAGISCKKSLLYSYLREIVDNVREVIETIPNGVSLDLNDYLTIARIGKLEKSYMFDGNEYKYIANYLPVDNIERQGKECFVNRQTGKSKVSIDFFKD